MKAELSRILAFWGLIFCFFSSPLCGLVLFDTDYEFETYAVFGTGLEGAFHDMVFGSDGNLYVTWSVTKLGRDGVVYKVSPTGEITVFAADLVRPTDIIWAGGSDYGDYFYVCDPYERESYEKGIVIEVAPNGTKRLFASEGLNNPVSVQIDRTGTYGGFLYVGSGLGDRINTVSKTVETELFYSIGHYSGSPRDIAFDENGQYDWLMYVAAAYPDKPDISGILTFNPEGHWLGRFAREITEAYGLEFDRMGVFDGDMFVSGIVNDFEESRWILRV